MNWKNLIQTKPHRVKGYYHVIKFTPNLVAQEVFNIGIVFTDSENNRHIKMLENTKAFECLYGKQGAIQVQNMVNYAEDMANSLGDSLIPSPHLSYTTPIFTQGLTIQQILSGLYKDYILLNCAHGRSQDKRKAINTEDLRQKIFSHLKKKQFESALHEAPIRLPSSDTELDLPIWSGTADEDLLGKKKHFFATLISADFIKEAYLGYNLNTVGAMNIQTACEIMGERSRAGFFVYSPTPNENGIDETEYQHITTHIDKTEKNVTFVASRTNTTLHFKKSNNMELLEDEMMNFMTG